MLSILPYERAAAAATSQSNPHRHSDRPFKSYARTSLPSAPPTAHAHNSSYLSPFGHNIIGSLHPLHQVNHLKQDAPMDLRPQASMFDGRDSYEHHASTPYMDLSAQIPNRIPNIKSEEQGLVNVLYPQVNTNPAHSNGYSPSLGNLPSMRDMSPPTQASLPGLNGAVSSATATTVPDMRSLDTRVGNGSGMFTNSLHGHALNHSSSHPAPHTSPQPHVVSPHSNPSTSSSNENRNSDDDDDEEKRALKRAINNVPEEMKDRAYWDKRKKNNDSAKRSREARRIKEEQIAMRVVYLEQDNLQLRTEVSLLKSEIEKLRCMLYNS